MSGFDLDTGAKGKPSTQTPCPNIIFLVNSSVLTCQVLVKVTISPMRSETPWVTLHPGTRKWWKVTRKVPCEQVIYDLKGLVWKEVQSNNGSNKCFLRYLPLSCPATGCSSNLTRITFHVFLDVVVITKLQAYLQSGESLSGAYCKIAATRHDFTANLQSETGLLLYIRMSPPPSPSPSSKDFFYPFYAPLH